ncbi:MAG: hypothetical protein SGILL_005608 [Bacillariaceae sp.]
MREIPSLSVLCLRAIASSKCSTEETFAPVNKDGKRKKIKKDDVDDATTAATAAVARASVLEGRSTSVGSESMVVLPPRGSVLERTSSVGSASMMAAADMDYNLPGSASKLLRSFHERPAVVYGDEVNIAAPITDDDDDKSSAISKIPLQRTPAIGAGSGRRKQANDIDLNHPWIAVYHPHPKQDETMGDEEEELPDVPTDPENQVLVAQYGSPALDLLQSYIDSLVEMGRMDDGRLRLHFFQEFKANIELHGGEEVSSNESTPTATEAIAENAPPDNDTPTKGKKRGRNSPKPSSKNKKKSLDTHPSAKGSLSLYNTIFLERTMSAMIKSNVLKHIAVLDLTGVSTLNDDMLEEILMASNSQLQRLSVKNCRRLTNESMHNLVQYCGNLVSMDLGGAYNITTQCVLESISPLQSKSNGSSLSKLIELHASGLGWTSSDLATLFSLRPWRALSVGFSPLLYFGGWKDAIWADSSEAMSSRLQSLAVPFCEQLIDNAWLGMMGRHTPHLRALDVRGCTGLNSLTGWYDGRATIVPGVPLQQSLIVLARYSNITKSSVEETKRVHPAAALPLVVILDSEGVGLGILRMEGAV